MKEVPMLKTMVQKHPVLSKILLIGFVLYASWYVWTQPHFWKELDPTKPGFDATAFRFEDYPDEEELARVIGLIVPLGSTVEHIDNTIGRDADIKNVTIQCKQENVFKDSNISYYYPLINRIISSDIWGYVENGVISFRFFNGKTIKGKVRLKNRFLPIYNHSGSDFCITK